ncbi:hypothetical protein SAMN02745704_02941 [Paucidesulfovibrio gracilis DSM 16080]|uniref:Uncharacterized protein n=1 Tax=Paucidesulfovibrio gracilis DSM 16080 TaxID=1121449 RepID=A0A1T4YBJ5_9BACT|nr:hypothetical protein [Paucidesulfovibrio gracilis]SKA98671.1 hypothetical protein SAMN02745704_02941 [Paucidesulfovibrio gracilis DSM 16080]
MRVLRFFTVLMVISAIFFYNTTWFQSMFSDDFYKNIAEIQFDVLHKGNTISIPIKYKYKTCYDLGIAVPGKHLMAYRKEGPGRLHYKFISDGNMLTEGFTRPVSRHNMGGNDDYTALLLMVFDLPLKENVRNVILELEVVEPFTFLAEYKGQTSIIINPNYEPKVGGCYNESLRIIQ